MKIICFSDLHFEFEEPFTPPAEDIADVMILAGDIITFSDFTLFEQIVKAWQKPILLMRCARPRDAAKVAWRMSMALTWAHTCSKRSLIVTPFQTMTMTMWCSAAWTPSDHWRGTLRAPAGWQRAYRTKCLAQRLIVSAAHRSKLCTSQPRRLWPA